MKATSLFFHTAFLYLGLFTTSDAVRLPVTQKVRRGPADVDIYKRGSVGVMNAANGDNAGDTSLTSQQDIVYTGNVTIGGSVFTLQLDTGSSDMWVATNANIANTNQSDLTLNLTYGIGYAYGHITQATVSFVGFDVPNQAFLLATQANNPVSNYNAQGILGLGFTSLSSIDFAVNKSGADWGRSFLLNTFNTDPSTPNFISFALSRSDDPDDPVQGMFTIGEYVQGYESVAQMPNVSTFPEASPSRWNVLLDAVYVGGVQQSLSSSVANAPFGKAVALIDSGTSYSYIDPNIAKAMYDSAPGSSFDSSSGIYTLPCDTEVDVTLEIGGQFYPLHPLDVVAKKIGSSDTTTCTGTFVGQSLSVSNNEFDYLFGDNTLRSIYTVYDFGDFQADGSMGNPYMKLLSLTNATEASEDFHQQRGGTANTTVSASGVTTNSTSTTPSSGSGGSASDTTTDVANNINKILNYVPIFLGLMAFNAVVLLGLAVCAAVYFLRRRKGKKGSRGSLNDYHYQRVRSQYDPKDIGPDPSGLEMADTSGKTGHALSRPPMPDRQGSDTSVQGSIRSILKNPNATDEPFTPPALLEDNEGDMSQVILQPPEITGTPPSRPHSVAGAHPIEPGVRPISTLSVGGQPFDPTSVMAVPRPRFISTTTMGSNSDMYGRPQSLFSVASGSPSSHSPGSPQRPMSSYDLPMGGGPRPRFGSNPMSEARPDSTFSTTPLMPKDGNSRPEQGQGHIRGMSGTGIPGMPNIVPMPGGPSGPGMAGMEGAEFITPPRPRFLSDANMGQRPTSAYSVDSGSAPQMRPQSRFIDASGRPASEAL